jgi:hypothetical protein
MAVSLNWTAVPRAVEYKADMKVFRRADKLDNGERFVQYFGQ